MFISLFLAMISSCLIGTTATAEESIQKKDEAQSNALAQPVQTNLSFKGVLLERGTNNPLSDVNIFLLPLKAKVASDESGNFQFDNLAPGTQEIVINKSGYLKLTKSVEISDQDSKGKTVVFYLEKQSQSLFETTVVGQKERRDNSQKTLRREEFLSVPGAAQDPIKAVQNMPGVNRTSGLGSQVVIQGAAPGDTRYLIDGIEVPIIFHFGGFSSVVIPQVVDQVNYFSAGYGPKYSRAMGGIIELKTRNPELNKRKQKGFFFVDTLNAGGLYERQLTPSSSFMIGGRYSYIGPVIKSVAKKNDALSLTVAPEFSDLTMAYQNQLTQKDEFRILATGSKDRLSFLFKEPLRDNPTVSGSFDNKTQFFRIIPQWKHRYDLDRTLSVSTGIGQDTLQINVGDQFFKLRSNTLSLRAEYDQKISESYNYQIGMDHQVSESSVTLRLPLRTDVGGIDAPIGSRAVLDYDKKVPVTNLGFYFRNEFSVESIRTKIAPSLRMDRFSQTQENLLAPRLSVQHDLTDSFLLKAATGLYYQPPQPQESVSGLGNPNIKAPRVWHYTVGFEKDFRNGFSNGFTWNANYFDRQFDRLVVNTPTIIERNGVPVAELYNNSGKGRAYGFDQILKVRFDAWSGWISYTWLHSRRRDPLKGDYRAQYDQTHNLNIVAARDLPKQWRISTRYRYVTGNTITPVSSATFDADQDVYIPKAGAIYSERLRDFSQLDLRIDKRWTLETQVWSLYLDIQNVLNTKNPENINYSFNYKDKVTVTGIPLLPAFGLRGEF